VKLVSELVDAEGVPFLAGFRYAETGMEKRAAWEETWRLQRLEDEGKLEPEQERLGLKAIPVPDKYANKDFLRHYWGLRGKLDVPKERFVTVPAGNNEDDPTPLVRLGRLGPPPDGASPRRPLPAPQDRRRLDGPAPRAVARRPR
jgi:hypothetical protein